MGLLQEMLYGGTAPESHADPTSRADMFCSAPGLAEPELQATPDLSFADSCFTNLTKEVVGISVIAVVLFMIYYTLKRTQDVDLEIQVQRDISINQVGDLAVGKFPSQRPRKV